MRTKQSKALDKAAHQELWQWCADNPDKNKTQWPRWSEFCQQRDDGSYCFACQYGCTDCPCWWGADKTMYRVGVSRYCMSSGTVYRKYLRAIYKGNRNLVRLYATRIRDAWVL